LTGLPEDFFRELPKLETSRNPLLPFGIEGCRRNDEEIFTDGLDSVLSALVVPKRLPMGE